MINFFKNKQIAKGVSLLRLSAFIVPLAIVIGLMVAFFLWLLEVVTNIRLQHEWLLFLLPLAGVVIVWLYKTFGKNSDKGNNLIIDEIHKPDGGIPFRMMPLVLLTTIITHLFGGSAGREGTAVQMGGSTAALFSKWLKLNAIDKRVLLLCGMSAGFGAVFGTPVAGAVFDAVFDAVLDAVLDHDVHRVAVRVFCADTAALGKKGSS